MQIYDKQDWWLPAKVMRDWIEGDNEKIRSLSDENIVITAAIIAQTWEYSKTPRPGVDLEAPIVHSVTWRLLRLQRSTNW